ncbi:MAG: hypothetical protein Kow0058_14310 [Roseovarius sp.]
MKFTSRHDVEAPIAFVFAQMTDFAALERQAMHRGADVQRIDKLNGAGTGMMWDAQFKLRGKRRQLRLELTDLDPPNGLAMTSQSANLDGRVVADLVALSRDSTRVTMAFELRPRTLPGKLLVQSLKLARRSLSRRIDERLTAFFDDIAGRYAAGG